MDNHEHDMDELMKKGWSYPKNKVSDDEGNILERRDNGLYVPASGVSISDAEGNALTQKTDGLYVPTGAVEISEEDGNLIEQKADGLFVGKTEPDISFDDDNILEKKEDGLYVPKTEIDISPDEDNILEKKDNGLYVPEIKGVEISEEEGNTIELKEDGLYVPETEIKISEEEGNTIEKKEDGLYSPKCSVDISEETGNSIVKKTDGIYVPESKTKVLEIDAALTEAELLEHISTNYEGYKCSGFFYNADQDEYCEFEALYSSKQIGSDIVHFGYCHIKGVHDAVYSVDYYIDDEDDSKWNKVIPNDYIETSDSVELKDSDVIATSMAVATLNDKVEDIRLFKFPNAVINGEPTINNGQVSGFATTNYLVLPSVFNLHGRGFEFKFAFTTNSDVTTAQNILGSKFCMAMYIQNGKIFLRVSSNGSSWDLVNIESSTEIAANRTYYAKIVFDRLGYKLMLSTDDEGYDQVGETTTGNISPFPSELYLGVGNNFHNPFKGIINLNKCYLKVNQSIVWQGMDDAGLATRLATDLANIDNLGIEAIKEIIATEGYLTSDDITGKLDKQLTTATDANECLSEAGQTALYYLPNSAANIPVNDNFAMMVYHLQVGTAHRIIQHLFQYGSSKEYFRQGSSTDGTEYTFKDWKEVATTGIINDVTTTSPTETYSVKRLFEAFATKESVDILNGDAETEGSVKKTVADAIAATTHLTKQIIDHKPTVEEAKENILYLVPSSKEGIYKQYTLVGGEIIDLDNTEVDLSGYVQKETGKSLVLDTDIAQITANKEAIEDITTDLNNYVLKEDGKGLSTNDYDNTEKQTVATNKSNIDSLNIDAKSNASRNLAWYFINGNIESNGRISRLVDATTKLYFAKVKGNTTYTLSTDGPMMVYAYFSSLPTIGSISDDASRVIVNASTETITPTYDCYIVVRAEAEKVIQVEAGAIATEYKEYNGNSNNQLTDDITKLIAITDKTKAIIDKNRSDGYLNSGNMYGGKSNTIYSFSKILPSSTSITISWENMTGTGTMVMFDDLVGTNQTEEIKLYSSDNGVKTIRLSTAAGSFRINSPFASNIQVLESDTVLPYMPKTKSNIELANAQAFDTHNTCVNLLQPTLQTTTQNGVTCTNNGDGTYTLNGTNNKQSAIYFYLINDFNFKVNETREYKMISKEFFGDKTILIVYKENWSQQYRDGGGSNTKFTFDSESYYAVALIVEPGTTCDNLIFKPMITTDLNATYDDFVPYTGDTGRLNGDVSELRSEFATNAQAQLDLKMLGWSVPEEMPIKNYVDNDGVFHQRVDRVDLGSLIPWYDENTRKYIMWGERINPSGNKRFIADLAKTLSNMSDANIIYTTKYKNMPVNQAAQDIEGIGITTSVPNTAFVAIYDDKYKTATAAEFIQAMKGVYLYYELAEEKLISMDGNEAVTRIKEAQADYGLDNKFDGEFEQGYYTVQGIFTSSDKHISTRNSIKVKSGDLIKIKPHNAVDTISIACYNNTTFVSRLDYSDSTNFIIPNDVNNIKVTLYASNGLNVNANSMGVYVNSEIDRIIDNSYFLQKMAASKGTFLGTEFTAQQKRDIANGDFSRLPLGGYWTIGGHNWRIWDADWYLNKGDTPCTEHHLVIMPDDNLLKANSSTTHYMQDTDTTAGGYAGTKYRSTYRQQCDEIVKNCFGTDSILVHRELMCTAVTNGKPSGWGWVDATSELPSEVMMTGTTIWSNYTDGGSGFNVGTSYPQLALARIAPQFVINRENYFERDVVSASCFAYVNGGGNANYADASSRGVGVRPYLLLKGAKQ